MNCYHCNQEIILVPSAAERAAKYGGRPENYTNLFRIHNQCQLDLRAQQVSELLQRNREHSHENHNLQRQR